MTPPHHPLPAARVVAAARVWLGTPYQHQASCRGVGVDCLGLLRGIYLSLYGQPATRPPVYRPFGAPGDEELLWQAAQRHLQPATRPWQAGQAALFRLRPNLPARHVAIISSTTHMIHALNGAGVCEMPLTRWWRRHGVAWFDFPTPTQNPPTQNPPTQTIESPE